MATGEEAGRHDAGGASGVSGEEASRNGRASEELAALDAGELAGIWTPDVGYSNETTFGRWQTEEEAASEFDRRVKLSPLFRNVYSEVEGEYLQPRLGTEGRRCRIDRILMPSAALEEAGWPHGPIGVEIEASFRKVAGPIEQCMDYSRAVWTIKEGYHVMVEWFFIWPWGNPGGNVGSLAVQHRIGGVSGNQWAPLIFQVPGMNVIRWNANGTIEAKRLAVGRKTGHRARKG